VETFVIQMPTQPEGSTNAGEDDLRGVVEHVASGRRQSFASPRELLAFLHVHQQAPAKEFKR
jgi:hypothetical protein